MTPIFESTFKKLFNEILLPKYKRIRNETARYADHENPMYTGSRSAISRTPGEIQHGIGGSRYKTNSTIRYTNQDPSKTFTHKSKRDPRQTKRMDGSGVYRDDERLGNSKLNLRVSSKFGPYTRMRPILNNTKKYRDAGIQRKHMKRHLDNQP